MSKARLAASAVVMAALATGPTAMAAGSTVVGFDGGTNGGFQGNAFFEASGGNPGGVAHTAGGIIEFPELRSGAIGEPSNPAFLGDYSKFTNIKFSVDVKTVSLTDFDANETSRPFGVMLLDRDIQGNDGPSGVFFQLGLLGVDFNPNWTRYSVTIADPTSTTLPAGWVGFGHTNLATYEIGLPAGATFATVLAGVDEFRISGAVPGFYFDPVVPDYYVDNIAVSVPEPATAALFALGALVLMRRRGA